MAKKKAKTDEAKTQEAMIQDGLRFEWTGRSLVIVALAIAAACGAHVVIQLVVP